MQTFSAFIDETYVKDNSAMGKSIDPLEFNYFIRESQAVYIQDILGTPLYEDLMNKVYMTGPTVSISSSPYLNTYERWLFELVSKSQAHRVIELSAFSLTYKLRNGGLAQTSAEHTNSAGLKEINALKEEARNLAEHWANRAIKFLCENSTQFPLYNASSDDIYPTDDNNDFGVYFPEEYKYGRTMTEEEFLRKYFY